MLVTEEAIGPSESGEDLETRGSQKSENKGYVRKKRTVPPNAAGIKRAGADRHRMASTAVRAGIKGAIGVTAENLLAPNCPRMDTPRGDRSPTPQERDKARRPAYSSIAMDALAPAQKVEHQNSEGARSECEQSFSATVDVGGLFLVSQEDSVAMLDTAATANMACFRWLEHHNRLPEEHGFQKVSTFPSTARFRSWGGRLREVRRAADIPAGVVGNRGKFAAFVLDADVPAFLRKLEKLGGRLDFPRDALALRK